MLGRHLRSCHRNVGDRRGSGIRIRQGWATSRVVASIAPTRVELMAHARTATMVRSRSVTGVGGVSHLVLLISPIVSATLVSTTAWASGEVVSAHISMGRVRRFASIVTGLGVGSLRALRHVRSH